MDHPQGELLQLVRKRKDSSSKEWPLVPTFSSQPDGFQATQGPGYQVSRLRKRLDGRFFHRRTEFTNGEPIGLNDLPRRPYLLIWFIWHLNCDQMHVMNARLDGNVSRAYFPPWFGAHTLVLIQRFLNLSRLEPGLLVELPRAELRSERLYASVPERPSCDGATPMNRDRVRVFHGQPTGER